MVSGLVLNPKSITIKTARIGIDTLIDLKHCFRIAPILARVLESLSQEEGHKNQLIDSIAVNLRDDCFELISQNIDALLTESTEYSKKIHEMRHQECFAIRPMVNSFLDVARKTFLQSVEDIHEAAETYSLSLGASVKVAQNSSRGYYFSVPSSVLGENDFLPAEFIQPVINKKSISCTTEEVSSLSGSLRPGPDYFF